MWSWARYARFTYDLQKSSVPHHANISKSYFGWSILRVGERNQAYCRNRPVSTQFNRYGAKDSQNICQYRSEERKEVIFTLSKS